MSKRWVVWLAVIGFVASCTQELAPRKETPVVETNRETAPTQETAPPEAALHVGAATAPINPENGTWLAGYSPSRRSTEVHDNLYAKAVVFNDGKTPVALVTLDSLGTMYDTIQQIRARAAKKVKGIDLPAERVIVQSTHTHCSPDVIGIYGPDQATCGRDPKYMNLLIETASNQVAQAAEALQPATLAYTTAEGMEWAVNDSEPGVIDRTAVILQCSGSDGEPVVTLTNFACHPTVLDGDTSEVSSDWVGAFYKTMSENMKGEHLFLQGSVGGWIQPLTPERTFALAEQYGVDLAQQVLKALKNTIPVKGTEIRFAHKVFAMPNSNESFKQMSLAGLVPRPLGDTIETEVAWFAVGSAQFATHPGETAPAFTWATRDLMDTEPKFVLGLGLDQLGYIVKTDYFDNTERYKFAEYLTEMSPGREAGPALMAALEAIVP
ncbi:MAG: neutral/alkaline non-lysosomal ceramidase N-terminal domain-containing protein [Candidatus Hydrogenedentes bacterium]|nr:neutral/alkaline non-lysosomal ceramidase N-terminal domain-containing protein [Candidatus Hydrogenedentota bacterium]